MPDETQVVNCASQLIDWASSICYLKNLSTSDLDEVPEMFKDSMKRTASQIISASNRALHQAGMECLPEVKDIQDTEMRVAADRGDFDKVAASARQVEQQVESAIKRARERVGLPARTLAGT